MKKYFDYDPYNPKEVKDEIHQIDTNGMIRLVHVPAINSISIKNFTAVTSAVSIKQDEFFCEYSLDTLYREANRVVRFNKLHAGQVVKVNYLAVGSPVTATDMNEIKEHLDSAVTLISGLANSQTTLAAAVASLANQIPDDIEAHNTSPDAHQDIRELIADSQYTLPTATRNIKGGVKVGGGLKMIGETLNCTLEVPDEYTLPTASDTRKGGVKVGEGLEMVGDTLNVTLDVPDKYTLPTASKYNKGGVKIGEGLAMSGETLNVTLEVPDNYSLPTASDTRKGGVKVGDGLQMNGEVLNVTLEVPEEYTLPTATSYRKGGVKVGNGLQMSGETLNVTLAVPDDYTLPTAATNRKGGIKVGDGLAMDGEVLNVTAVGGGDGNYILPTATATKKGGVKVGDGLAMNGDTLTCTVSEGTLALATTSYKGLMSASDKRKLNGIEYYAQENLIEQVAVDGEIQPIVDKVAILSLSGYAKKSDFASGMHVKGSVEYFDDLPTDATPGDVYNIKSDGGVDGEGIPVKAGDNVVFTTEGKWDVMAGFIDFSDYVKKVPGKQLSTNDFTNALKDKLLGLENYELPKAGVSTLGGVMVGEGLKINGSGVLSTDLDIPDEYTLPTASSSTKGGVKIGTGLKMSGETLNCTVEAPSYSNATTVASGLMSASDKIKLNGLQNYTLPAATKTSLGGIIPGAGLSMAGNSLNVLFGEGLSIADNTLTVTMVSGETYDVFTGATNSRGGTSGLVPPPAVGDQNSYLRGNGTWSTVSAGTIVVNPLPENNSVEITTGVPDVQGALWYDVIDGQPVLRLRYGERTFNFEPDISEISTATSTLVTNVGVIYELGTTPATVMGGLWYEVKDDAPVLCVQGKNFKYGYLHDNQTYVGDDTSLVSYLPCDNALGYDAKGWTWNTKGSPAIVTNPVTGKKALNCDGSLEASSPTSIVPSGSNWTCDFWLTIASNCSYSAKKQILTLNTSTNSAFYLHLDDSTSTFNALTSSLASVSALKGKRTHVALVNNKSASRLNIYVNGESKLSSTTNRNFSVLNIFSGYSTLSGIYIDHFRIRTKVVWTGDFTVPDALEYI